MKTKIVKRMRTDTIITILRRIESGENTLYALSKSMNNKSAQKYLQLMLAKGLIERIRGQGRSKQPYALTDKGKTFLKLME